MPGYEWYTDEELLNYLRKVAEELDKTPTMAEFSSYRVPNTSTYARRFGSWKNACKEAGLEPNDSGRPRYDDENLLKKLSHLGINLGRRPKAKEVDEASKLPTEVTYQNHFGNLSKAWELAVDKYVKQDEEDIVVNE